MKIIADTREISPLSFRIGGALTEVVRSKLDVGDYRAQYTDGTYSDTVFERKSLGDLYGTMTSGYQRFKKELTRSRNSNINLILIVECSFSEVASGYEHSTWEGGSMIKKLGTMWFKHALPVLFMNGRDDMAGFIVSYFTAEGYAKIRKGEGNEKKR